MKLFITLVCCLAVPLVATAENQDGQGGKKKKGGQGQGQQQQQHQQVQGAKQGKHQGQGQGQGKHPGQAQGQGQGQGQHNKGKNQNNVAQGQGQGQGQHNKGKNGQGNNQQANKGKMQTKQFKLGKNPNPKIQSVKFQANHHIEGSEHWQGQKYVVFQNYNCQWHDQGWWHSHYPRVVLVFGGWYYFSDNYWFPAWGYDAGQSYYAYDGPIYAHHGLSPDQVVANVQSALQEQGYYHGEVDGLLGPMTRDALAAYQRDQGLATTAAVDEPTLDALGLS